MKTVTISEDTGPDLSYIWAFVARGKAGHEKVLTVWFPGFPKKTPLITGNPETLALFSTLAMMAKGDFEQTTGQTIHLLRYSSHVEIQDWSVGR